MRWGREDVTADPYVPGHGDLRYAVRRYDLELDYRLEGNRLAGKARIAATALRETDRIALDLHRLEATKVVVDAHAPAKYRQSRGRLEIQLAKPLREGQQFTVAVTYKGHPAPMPGLDGEAGWEELADGVIVASQPHGAPSWFPCNDRAADKAAYGITITAPSGYDVVANGIRAKAPRRSGSSVTWTFEQSRPMAPYLATVQIGRYTVHPLQAPVPLEVVLPQGRPLDVDAPITRHPEMLRVFTDLFGPYPFDSYSVVVTDDPLEIPLEAQTLSIFGSNFLDRTWQSERLMAHELSHQWFGNCVTAAAWKDIWLHEGFACYAEWLWSEHSGREPAAAHARVHADRLARLPQDLVLGDPGPELMFDDRVYKRGALLLHALRTTVGDEAFFDLLRTWVARHAFGSVATEQLVTLAEEVAGEDLSGLFGAWLRDPALPALPAEPR